LLGFDKLKFVGHQNTIFSHTMNILKAFVVSLLLVASFSLPAYTQTEPQAAWQVARYDITASPALTGRTLGGRAQVSIRNAGRGPGSRITLRINPKAEVKAVTANDAAAPFRVSQDSRTNQQRIEITLAAPVAPGGSFNVTVDYVLPLTENDGLASISPLGTQFLPLSLWFPTPSNPFSPRGADTAPFRLKVNGAPGDTTISSGKLNSGTFEQTSYSQPFFVSGSFDVIEGATSASGITAYLQKGAGADERKQAEAMLALAGAARAFYSGVLGPAPDALIKLVAVTDGGGFNDGGVLLLDTAAFRRSKIDATTAMSIAETVARTWIGGKTAVRSEGGGVLHGGLTRYLSLLFLEKQYGKEFADAERMRQRSAFATSAKRDAPLAMTTPLDPSYYSAVENKGAMIWRLAERALGRDAFLETVRTHLQERAGDGGGITLASLREALVARGGEPVKALLQYELDQPTDMDLIIGVPQARGGEWVVALRNLGGLDVSAGIAATTESGEVLRQDVTLPAKNFGEAVFKSSARLRRVEIDPDKLYPQFDYANDYAPRFALTDEAFVEADRMFKRQEYAKAETVLRDFLAASPNAEDARVLLGRTLLALNKLDQAEKEFRTALDMKAPTSATLAWANIGLGEISLSRGQAAQAVRHFEDAVRAESDYASTLAARAGRIKAETAAKTAPPVDESARAFVAQLDKAILAGRKADIEALILPGVLITFVKGVVGSQPEVWQTTVMRTEQIDGIRLAADVTLNVRQLGRDRAGTAVLILARSGGGWKLAGIEYLEER
jgi:hypothetical protein